MTEQTKYDRIFLQVCDDEDSEWCGEVTWCQSREHESDVKYVRADLVESLRQQLAAALAACKVKDEALRFYKSALTADDVAGRALTIQPDDSALNAWIGEPVAIMGSHGHPKHISYIPGIQEEKLYGPWIPLYAPKGMK